MQAQCIIEKVPKLPEIRGYSMSFSTLPMAIVLPVEKAISYTFEDDMTAQ